MTKLTTAIVKRTWNWTFSTSGAPGDNNVPVPGPAGENNNHGAGGKYTSSGYTEEQKEEH